MSVIIRYPTGQGGHWLSNLFYSLENKVYDIVPASINFHDRKLSNVFKLLHESNAPNAIGSFCSMRTQFITYLNGYYKNFRLDNQVQKLNQSELLYWLSNNACWRQELNGKFHQDYTSNIVLNADLLFNKTDAFAEQLYELLDQYNVVFARNTDYVLESIENFKKSCWTIDKIDISNNIPWFAWCHAYCLLKNIHIPIKITADINAAQEWFVTNQDLFLQETNKQFITHI
jgi:hypothetical protein